MTGQGVLRTTHFFLLLLPLVFQLVNSQEFHCNSDPCLNDGVCFEFGDGFFCSCNDDQLLLPRCAKDACEINPCMNDGSCTLEDGGYSCDCPAGYTGMNCTNDVCDSNPCQNGGACAVNGNAFTCTCVDGFTGDNCEVDPCNPNPCLNEGTCQRGGDGFICECPLRYSGATCADEACDATPPLCQNGGKCIVRTQEEDGFFCNCPLGYDGAVCNETVTVDCHSDPCQNGGICSMTGNDVTCTCQDGFTGSTCEEVSDNPGIPLAVVIGIAVAAVIVVILVIVLVLLLFCGRTKKSSDASSSHGPRYISEFQSNTVSSRPDFSDFHSNTAFEVADEPDGYSDGNDPPPAYGEEDETSLNGSSKPRIYDNTNFSNDYSSYGGMNNFNFETDTFRDPNAEGLLY